MITITALILYQALIPKLRDQDPNVVISVLAAIGEHAQASIIIIHTELSTCIIHIQTAQGIIIILLFQYLKVLTRVLCFFPLELEQNKVFCSLSGFFLSVQ